MASYPPVKHSQLPGREQMQLSKLHVCQTEAWPDLCSCLPASLRAGHLGANHISLSLLASQIKKIIIISVFPVIQKGQHCLSYVDCPSLMIICKEKAVEDIFSKFSFRTTGVTIFSLFFSFLFNTEP